MSHTFTSLRRHCCFTTVQLAEKHLRCAKELISTGQHEDVESALAPLDTALELYPNWEKALELKARVLLYLKRFKDVVELLHEFLPGVNPTTEHGISPSDSPEVRVNSPLDDGAEAQARGRISLAKLRQKLSLGLILTEVRGKSSIDEAQMRRGRSLSKLRRKLSSSALCKDVRPEAQLGWRYLILGQACCHLGMMEDAMILLQNGKKASSAVSRRHSNGMREDNFCSESSIETSHAAEFDLVNHMLANIKLLLRRRAAAEAALEAGLYSESARHFTKIIENQKSTPPGFVADCYLHRAIAYQATGRVVDAIADCNRTLALNPRCTKALSVRASLHEMVKSFSECLLDLQQLKMIYEASLRRQQVLADWAAPPEWTIGRHKLSEVNIVGGLDYINSKIMATRRRLCSRTCSLAARTILDLPQHCSMEDVEKAYLLLSLKHSPDKAALFVENCAQQDGSRDMKTVKEEARASALRLSQLIHRAYTKLLSVISEEEAEEKYERAASEAALRRRCIKDTKSLIQSHIYPEFSEENKFASTWREGSSDESGLADTEYVSYDEVNRISLSDTVKSEEDLAKVSNCRVSLYDEDKINEDLAKLSFSDEGRNAEGIDRKSVNDENRVPLDRETPVANQDKRDKNVSEMQGSDSLDDMETEKAMMRGCFEPAMCNGGGDDSKKVMMVVMEALTIFNKQCGSVDMESREEKLISAAIKAEPDRSVNGELRQLMSNYHGGLCSEALASAISQALSLDNPNLLAHHHWLMNISDSISWSLPLSQPLSVT